MFRYRNVGMQSTIPPFFLTKCETETANAKMNATLVLRKGSIAGFLPETGSDHTEIYVGSDHADPCPHRSGPLCDEQDIRGGGALETVNECIHKVVCRRGNTMVGKQLA